MLSYSERVINEENEIHQEISQKLNAILEHARVKTIDDTNSSSLMSDCSVYNGDDKQQPYNTNLMVESDKEDSSLDDDILKQSLAVTYKKLSDNDDDADDGIEVIPDPAENDDAIKVLQCSCSFDSFARKNSKNSIFDFQNELSKIIEEDDDGIEIISESEKDDNLPEQNNILLERQNSEDSALGSELE